MSFFVKKINSEMSRIVSTVAVSVLTMSLVLILAGGVMNRALLNAESQYYESCNYVLDGYSTSIDFFLENYVTSLTSVYDEKLFSTGDGKKIQSWLSSKMEYVHEDFCSLFYIDENKIGWFNNGSVIDLKERTYIRDADFSDKKYFISNIQPSIHTDDWLFIVQKPVLNKDGAVKGILNASIKASALEKITQNINISRNAMVYVQDRNGKLLVHPKKEFIGRTFTPKKNQNGQYSSEYISKLQGGMIQTEDEAENSINLLFKKIDRCGWTLCVAFSSSELEEIYGEQRLMSTYIFIISFLSLMVLLFFEHKILNSFYRAQIVDFSYDPLTKLWTRERFEKEVAKLIRHNPKTIYILIETDIRGFKFINQNYGKEAGDKLIFFYSQKINAIANDRHGLIGHGYADRFYTFGKVPSVRAAMSEFKKTLDELLKQVQSFEIPFFPKFGITFFRAGKKLDMSVSELIGQASFAKSTIKDNMLVNYAIYNSKMLRIVNRERDMEMSMEGALKKGEFIVLYQPKISLKTDKVVGAEALVRWKTKDLGVIAPSAFIPLFERNGFIKKIDFCVYEQVFKFLQSRLDKGLPVVPISVNMSRNHNKPDKFMHDFLKLFKKYSIPANLIQVEIIERSFMDTSTLCEITDALHKEGFSVAMDDFGSGESSLNMLTKIPVDVLKFDREFLLSSTDRLGGIDSKSAKFLQILVDLGKHLDKQTVFEGVETKEQRDFLRSISCDQVQGYFYSRPLFESDFVEFLAQHS